MQTPNSEARPLGYWSMRHYVLPARARYAVAELDMKNVLCYAEDRKRKDYYDSLEQMD